MIDWKKVKYFNPSEFSEDPDIYADPELIYSLDKYRGMLGVNRIFPSPAKYALARSHGSSNSQHWVGPNLLKPTRKSTAVDIFCEGVPYDNYAILLGSKLFNGIGVYLSTTGPDGLPWVMFHVDTRKTGFNEDTPLVWIVRKFKDDSMKTPVDHYYYPQVKPKYWSLFGDKTLTKQKKFGSPATLPIIHLDEHFTAV